MATQVIMPKVDMVMETGTFVEWLKKEGDRVEKGEPLFVILTDKANIEIEAPASGILTELRAQPDDIIPVTEVIAVILEPEEVLPPQPDLAAEGAPTPALPSAAPTSGPAISEPATGKGLVGAKVRATPAARRLARELGIDLSQVSGGGQSGRIHKNDVETFANHQLIATEKEPKGPQLPSKPLPATAIPLPRARQKQVVPFEGPRKIIAERMTHSALTAPHITLALRVDMSEATRLRSQLQGPIEQRTGLRLSFTAIIARAVAAILPRHPYLNASLAEAEIILWEDIHLGIAVSLEDYLIVPVLREAQSRNLEQIVRMLGDLLERARSRRLAPAEMSGSTFTISNLGMFGIESFTPIINPPESASLAVGKIVNTPVSTQTGIELRPMMNLTLSADHRVVDGAAAARFLADVRATLENPYLLI